MPHPNNSMREDSNASADSEHFEPQEFTLKKTNTEDRHANYGMHEMPSEETAGPKDSTLGMLMEKLGNKIGNESIASHGYSKRVERGLEEQAEEVEEAKQQ